MRKRSFLIGLALIIACASTSIAYDEYTVHRSINENALVQSRTDSYLKNQLGFTKGIEEAVNGQSIRLWVMDGGKFEDETIWRTRLHFHDPLQPLDEAGLLNIYRSSLVWAQDTADNLWSWQKARWYYYEALIRVNKDIKEVRFSETFKALGHVMHLVSDVSVPAHARGDGHLLPDEFETWTKKNQQKLSYTGILIKQSIFDQAVYHSVATAPISALWDINMYEGYNPEVAVGTSIGLAEYSNANFLTQDTMWTYSHPSLADTDYNRINWLNPVKIDAEDGKEDNRIYLRKTTGEEIYPFTVVDYWTYEYQGHLSYIPGPFSLDEECWREYAARLIPRAVGYSAGVLDYFFRGKIELTRKSYAKDSVILFAKNVTDGSEEMSNGTVKLVVKYMLDNKVFYIVADEKNGSSSLVIPRNNGIELTFDLRNDPIPADAKDITLQVVYRGKLGKEIDGRWIGEDDAVAVGLIPYVLFIVLHKKTGDTTDWWYYDLDKEKGYHRNPSVPLPSKPEIISKGWTCEGLEEKEYYTRATPALSPVESNACTDNCGLINFKGQCCSGSSGMPNDSKTWGTCPCGGDWKEGAYGWYCSVGPFECQGGANIGDPFRESKALAGCGNNYNRTSNVSRPCQKGESWGVAVGDLTERMDIGPRSRTSGYESKTTCTVESAVCGPYPYSRRCCDRWCPPENPCYFVGGDKCIGCCGKWDPYSCGTECKGAYDACTNWFLREPGSSGPAAWRWSGYSEVGGSVPGGCLVFTSESKSAGYNTEDVPLITRVKVGEVEILFEGYWNQSQSNPGTVSSVKKRDGYANSCQPCQKETLATSSHSQASYSYTETSYGVAGWRTVVTDDGRFAVLIPRLNLTVSATSTDGKVSGSISGPTTALLRVVDIIDENPVEKDFELAKGEIEYSLSGMPSSRDDLGIKPNCYPLDLPLDIDLRGLHWYGDNAFLVTFVLQDVFYAYLLEKKKDTGWQAIQLKGFGQWVLENNLKDHLMFLN